MIESYFQGLLDVIAASPFVSTSDISFDKRSSSIGFVRGAVHFADESVLHLRELVDLRGADIRSTMTPATSREWPTTPTTNTLAMRPMSFLPKSRRWPQ